MNRGLTPLFQTNYYKIAVAFEIVFNFLILMTIEARPNSSVVHPPAEEGLRTLETRTSLRVIIPKNSISEILARCGDPDEGSPAYYAEETARALQKTREVIVTLAPWPERNQTVIHTPILVAPLNRDEISSYFRILFHQEEDDILYEMVLQRLKDGKKVIISSTFG